MAYSPVRDVFASRQENVEAKRARRKIAKAAREERRLARRLLEQQNEQR